MTPAELAASRTVFDDERLQELLFRYRARNFPDTLDAADAARWEGHRAARLLEGDGGARTLDDFLAAIDTLDDTTAGHAELVSSLHGYAESIYPHAEPADG